MEEILIAILLLLIEISTVISAIRFKEDSKIVIEPEETLNLELINESPRDGESVSITLHTMKGEKINVAQQHNLSSTILKYKIPVELAGSGLTEIVAKSETGAECSTIIFIK